MNCKKFCHVDTRCFQLSGKFEWLIHYLFFVMNGFVFLNPLKCQFCTNRDTFLAGNTKSANERSFKWS